MTNKREYDIIYVGKGDYLVMVPKGTADGDSTTEKKPQTIAALAYRALRDAPPAVAR